MKRAEGRRDEWLGISHQALVLSGCVSRLPAIHQRPQSPDPDLRRLLDRHSSPPSGVSMRTVDAQAAVVSSGEAETTPSFDAFYLSLFAPLYRSMLVLSGIPAEAEDVAHDAFVRVFERWSRSRGWKRPLPTCSERR